jgi:DNA polymerase-3 subunit epsilon
MKLPVLPVYYYLDHFTEMLSFVETTYGSVLADEHRTFVARFNGFSQDARCLLIRMINRRGTIFNSGHFRYEEISNLERALADSGAVDRGRG